MSHELEPTKYLNFFQNFKMKLIKKALKILFLTLSCLMLIYFAAFFIRKTSVVKQQITLQTNHFKIHYSGILKSEAESISNALEENYEKIRAD